MKRPAPYVPLSVTFHTGRTGSAILNEFGLEGLAVWTCLIASSADGQPYGTVMFSHDQDWGAIGLAMHPPSFTLYDFLKLLGRNKQTRKTQHGRNIYVTLTAWERWNNIKATEVARLRKARSRAKSERDIDRDLTVTSTGQAWDNRRDPDTDTDTEKEGEGPSRGTQGTSAGARNHKGLTPEEILDLDPDQLAEWEAELSL
jgi:hypothetical protein